MSTELYNQTTGKVVDVPDEAVDAYLSQPAYRKVKPADRTSDAPDTVSRDEHAALIATVAQLRADLDALAGVVQPKASA